MAGLSTELPVQYLDSTRWRATRTLDQTEFWQRWDALRTSVTTPFQDSCWLRDWYATLGAQQGVEPLLVRVSHEDEDVLLLPLLVRPRHRLRELLPADLGVSDYNAPRLRPGARLSGPAAHGAWTALRALLARHGDVLRVQKMLPVVDGQPNPLASVVEARPSELHGHAFGMPNGWDAWRLTLTRQVRREADRHWRVFARHPGARFGLAADLLEARVVLDRLQDMQDRRMAGNPEYRLADAPYQAFYRRRLENGFAAGQVVLSYLEAGGDIVAAAYGLRDAELFVMVRTAFDGDAWKPCAPGRLLMERTFAALADRGCRRFDIGVGAGSYKDTFNCEHVPLLEVCEALTPMGRPYAAAWHGLRRLRQLLLPSVDGMAEVGNAPPVPAQR